MFLQEQAGPEAMLWVEGSADEVLGHRMESRQSPPALCMHVRVQGACVYASVCACVGECEHIHMCMCRCVHVCVRAGMYACKDVCTSE